MRNRETDAALTYHEATKHSYASIRTNMHYMDWSNKPSHFKVYRNLPALDLPKEIPHPQSETIQVLRSLGTTGKALVSLPQLATILHYSGGLTKEAVLANGERFYFRAAACAGALYPIEFYLLSGEVEGLDSGLWHFSPLGNSLSNLRRGDLRSFLAEAAFDESISSRPATLIFTAITVRSSWKYQARSYRYHFWDLGTILANLQAVASALEVPARVVTGFVDSKVARLVAVDGRTEIPLALVTLGGDIGVPGPQVGALPPLKAEAEPVAPRIVEYPEILAFHQASALLDASEVAEWRVDRGAAAPVSRLLEGYGDGSSVKKSRPLAETILKRGSTRAFLHEPIGEDEFSSVVSICSRPPALDLTYGRDALNHLYAIVSAVEGVTPGAYKLDPAGGNHTLLRAGNFRGEAGYLCLEQELGADAAAVFFFLTDLTQVLERFGNRGYRVAQLEAGIQGGRMYLASYALGIGATGLTFYDDDVVSFFSPSAETKEPMFVVAIGRSARVRSLRARPIMKPSSRSR